LKFPTHRNRDFLSNNREIWKEIKEFGRDKQSHDIPQIFLHDGIERGTQLIQNESMLVVMGASMRLSKPEEFSQSTLRC